MKSSGALEAIPVVGTDFFLSSRRPWRLPLVGRPERHSSDMATGSTGLVRIMFVRSKRERHFVR